MTVKSKGDLLNRYLQVDPERFLSLLVHDVRVPLTSIVSAAKLIEALLNEDEQIDKVQIQEILTLILQSTDEMRDLLEVVVQYERIHQKSPSHE